MSATRAAVFGASGGIGAALVAALAADPSVAIVHAGSRAGSGPGGDTVAAFAFDLTDEPSIAAAAEAIGTVDLCIVATGELRNPEKSWSMQTADAYARAFAVNTIGPALIGKHMLSRLPRDRRSVFAALSARVGSIGDNRLGGWHAYRASKAALNMIVRNFANELAVRNPAAIAVTLHPGTVATPLSARFVGQRPTLAPEVSARALLDVLARLTEADSGGFFAYDGARIDY